MKIFQLIFSDKLTDDLQYANELYDAINTYYKNSIEINRININKDFALNDNIIDMINNVYDYVFIHCINNLDRSIYNKLYKDITIKKILFIVETNVKEFKLNYDLHELPLLLLNCHKIFVNKYSIDIKKLIYNIDNSISQNLIDLEYICNFDKIQINDISNNKEISFILYKTAQSKYDMYINMFMNKKNYLTDFYWNMYGVVKNIQTMAVDNLFINKKTNKKSDITNFDIENLCLDKINIFKDINNDIIKNAMFICDFNDIRYINYSLLNIISNGTIPIFYINYAKNIHINPKQTLYDINCGIYIDDDFTNNENILITLNKYIISSNTYKSLLIKNIKIFKQLFNTETTLKNLLNDIQ